MLTDSTQSTGLVKSEFPTYIQRQLDGPAPGRGGRHGALINLSYQMVGERIPDEVIFQELRRWIPEKDKTDKEIRDCISGAHKRGPQPVKATGTTYYPSQGYFPRRQAQEPRFKTYEHDGSKEDLPSEENKLTYSQFLKDVLGFKDDEYAWFANAEECWGGEQDGATYLSQWDKGTLVRSLSEKKPNQCCEGEFFPCIDDYSGKGFSPLGTYFAINPFKEGTGRKIDNVSRHLYTLIESDVLPREEQLAIYRKSNLPIRALIDSGGDSLHAIVCVDAANADEYKERVRLIHEYLGGKEAGFDATKDPTRFSRLPNSRRGEKRQRLLETSVGAESWQAWESGMRTGSTEWFDLDSLSKFDRHDDPNCVIGNRWLCRGGSLVIQGYSGIGKSSFALQMALQWSAGLDFFGLSPVRPLKTVFVQAENDKGDFAEPFEDITKSWNQSDFAKLRENFRAGREAETAGADRFAAYVRGLIAMHNPDILFFDPLLSYFGDDISKQKAASEFFRNQLQPIQNETGVIIVFIHHLGKPSQNGNGQRQGPAHYQGLGSSDIINWTRETIMLSEEFDGVYKMELGKRSDRGGFKEAYLKHSDSGVLWERAQGVNTQQDARSVAEKRKRENLEGFVRSYETVTLPQMKDCASNLGYGVNSIKTALEALAQNSAESDDPIYCYQAHVNGSRFKTTVFSTHPAPEDGQVKSKDLDIKISVSRESAEPSCEMTL